MDEDNPAESFQDEASCSLCLGFFQDPVSIHCGHNFCRACITRCWEEEEETFPCPRCKATATHPNLRPNRELAKIIEIAKRLSLRAPNAGERLCERHREVLKLFCEEDQAPICLVCRESQAHRLHAAVPIEEAVEEQKEKIQAHVQILKEKKEKLQGLKEAEEGKSLEFLEKVQQERQKVVLDIKELQQFVEQQESLLLGRLEKLDQEIVRRKEENLAKLLEEISSISEQIRELEEKCQQPPCEFLQDSRNILSRLENEKSPKVTEILPGAEENPTSPAQKNTSLKETLMQFQESLTLDPDTAHPRLVLSEDQKCVRWEEARHPIPDNNPKRFDSSRCVLGCQGFDAGRHYWEVEVGDGEAWAVGVAKESVERKGRISVKPEVGIWAVGQCGAQYQALTSPTSPITLLSAPKVIGIYLDYEAGRVAFFDANNEVPIFAYPPTSFGGERVLPLLCLGRGCRFTLCP
ncbi:E3 ubiquitin-protein ligase TRIM39-like [Phasianus colchicus]|uniref:Tripartite motif containing 39 n=1 Tax=Phasianus colchicus TaxID=9054 RepID=A0A669QT89_PHACC|nr:E3 ubiquitin-protein ligase TRIM39-like [Phasianus colchicus]